MKIPNRIGEKSINYQGIEMEIIEYRRHNDITVMFSDGTKRITSYKQFKLGTVKNLYFPSVYGIGFIGEEYSNKGNEVVYKSWSHMLGRCYNKKDSRYRFYGATGVKVCEEWHNFSNYAKWYYDNYYVIDEKLSVDKDIINKDSKIYSPETCIIIPEKINQMFTKTDTEGNKKIGVSKTQDGKYRAAISYTRNRVLKFYIDIGIYEKEKDAISAYEKAYKEKWKNLIMEYKNKIPYGIFKILINAV